jgi:hypothetical protein
LGVRVAYTNTGVIEVRQSTGSGSWPWLRDGATLLNRGRIEVFPGAELALGDGVTLATGATFTGSGRLFVNGTTTVTGPVTIPFPTILKGTLTGPGTVNMAASLDWWQGVISLAGGLNVMSGQTLVMNVVSPALTLINTSLRNYGAVLCLTETISLGGLSANLVNAAGAVWTFTRLTTPITSSGPPAAPGGYSIDNAGTIQGYVDGAGHTLSLGPYVSFSNTGTIINLSIVQQPTGP